jgi:hypothetical protein
LTITLTNINLGDELMSKDQVMRLNNYLPRWFNVRKQGGLYFVFVGPFMVIFCKRKRDRRPMKRVKARLVTYGAARDTSVIAYPLL